MSYGGRALTVKLKPDAIDPAVVAPLQAALAPRRIDLQDAGGGTWKLSSMGVKR